MNYNQVENALNYTGKALYNGNISETYWRTSSDNLKRKYGYFYDNLNRLKNAVYQKPNLAVPVTNSYNESLTYDKNGNITSLFRNGEYDDAGYALEIDRLEYNYDSAKPNQLTRVVDKSNNPNGFKDVSNEIDYTYDDFGNMESDANKGITRISYNHLNLPIEIAFGGTKHIRYLYNAVGQKISKTVTDGSVVTITEYLDGYQYIKPGADNYKLHFFPHAEGYVNTIGGNNYVFNYTDHLGNIRLSYGLDRGVLTILEENNYYPFGLKQENYNVTKKQYEKYGGEPELVTCVNCAYKYKYNGKELQDELGLNFYDYGARNYDPALGRWMNIDPLAELGRRWSPYSYAMDNPVFFIDPDGMWPNPFAQIESQVRGKIHKIKNSVKNAMKSIKEAASKVAGGFENGVQFWVTNDTKMDGFVKPDKAKDRSKVADADASGMSTVVTVLGTNKDKRGKTLKERTEGVTAVSDKADEAAGGGGKGSSTSREVASNSDEPSMVTTQLNEYNASDNPNNKSFVHNHKSKDTTVVESDVSKIDKINEDRLKKAETEAKTINKRRGFE